MKESCNCIPCMVSENARLPGQYIIFYVCSFRTAFEEIHLFVCNQRQTKLGPVIYAKGELLNVPTTGNIHGLVVDWF